MADRAPLRPGPDSTTDLVLHKGGGSRAWVVPIVLTGAAKSLLVPVALGAITGAVAVFALVTGTDAATVGQVVLGIAAVEAALAAPLIVWMELDTVRRLRFAPAQAPTRFRTVRAARPGPWQPITQLCGIRLEQRVTEPYPGDQQPVTEQLTVRVRPRRRRTEVDPARPHLAAAAVRGPHRAARPRRGTGRAGHRTHRPGPPVARARLDRRRLGLRQLRRLLGRGLTSPPRRRRGFVEDGPYLRALVRRVGSAVVGSSGQGWRG
ncbi:hypothetical protein [Streptomyces sp. NRRL B-24484]|uniref:hypothetical protein n=1 Tax=Streptomyces sp. NRRL B-24484 TaxID=1463833 RepID=UPI001331951D|nr:hypothetical protein [Streptomyces sp. NRRL B-24484]